MSEEEGSLIPIPDDPVDCSEENDRRLWIGNLDLKITEFALLKILQKFGSLERFDFLYHKTGPDQGKPRGYCFASFSSREDALKAMKSLDKKRALSKHMVVRWAHKQQEPVVSSTQESSNQCTVDGISAESKIRAIEMKLKNMERSQHDFTISTRPSQQPGTSKYSSAQAGNQKGTQRQTFKPYHRKETKR
ncbi:probable RNA-binding protein 18 [Mya arenaria]|uniref:probable RNA-binding protein 18 n=1 Tax=Mya arenaria TaxID=6604 RepID=UPI0022E6FD35|nr:probable RNA-binding protein 18 [Mya arenaria]